MRWPSIYDVEEGLTLIFKEINEMTAANPRTEGDEG